MRQYQSKTRTFSNYAEDNSSDDEAEETTHTMSTYTSSKTKETNGKRQHVPTSMRCDAFEPNNHNSQNSQNSQDSQTADDLTKLRNMNIEYLSESELMKQMSNIEAFLGIKK